MVNGDHHKNNIYKGEANYEIKKKKIICNYIGNCNMYE